jgi:ribosomal protein S12 methylthiotransferase accessory factor
MLVSKKTTTSLSNSYQKYNRSGINKVVSPGETLLLVKRKLKEHTPKILDRYVEVRKNTGIPQYYIKGTEYYANFVNRLGRSGSTSSSNGKGYKKIHALVSGLMEMVERYSCNSFLAFKKEKTIVRTFDTIKDNLFGEEEFFSNPVFKKKFKIIEKRVLNKAKLIWHKGYDLSGRKTLIPVSLITFMHEITNGMASGNSLEEALLHGICEVIERHCKSVIRDGRITPPTIDQKTIEYGSVRNLIKKFESNGCKIVLKNYSMDLGVPVVAAIREVGKGKVVVTVGVAPHPEEAITRALTENSQGDKGIDKSYYHHLFRRSETEAASTLPDVSDKNIKKEIESIEKLLVKKGMKIWYLDCTDKDLNIPAVFVFISGTRRNNLELSYRNAIIGLIEESLKMSDYKQATKFIKMGKIKDKKQIDIYNYYEGVVSCFMGDYKKATESFLKIKTDKNLEEMGAYLHIQLGSAYWIIGDNENFIKHLCLSIRKYPTMKVHYIRFHHHFSNKKMAIIRKSYNKLKGISGYLDINRDSFQKEFAKNLNSYTL